MAIRIVGNNHRGTYHTWNDVDNENPTATLYFEESIMFTPHVLTYPLYGNITAYYYKYADDVGVYDSYPVLYADNNGQPGEKLTENEPLMKTAWRRSTDVEGWIQAVVPMRRSVAVGEKVWFAFFGFTIAPRYDLNPVQTLWLAWWQDGLSIYSKPTERVGRVELESWRPKMRLSMYFTYSDVAPSVKYVRRIADIARSTSRVGLRWRYGRLTKPCLVRGSDSIQRVQTFVRKCTALCGVIAFFKRQHEVLRKQTSRVRGSSKLSKSRQLLRRTASLVSGLTSLTKRHELLLRLVSYVDGFSTLSNTRDFLLKMTSIASGSTQLTKNRGFLKRIASRVDGSTSLSKKHELLRTIASYASGFTKISFVYGIGAFVRSLVTACDKISHWRVISLVVRTLCGVWERFFRRKGVHRVEIVLYSPITLELKLGKK